MMQVQDEFSGEWPWTIEFRHKQEAKRVFFVIPDDERAGNGLKLLEEALGHRDQYFPPRGVHLANELLLFNMGSKNHGIRVALICPEEWYHTISGNTRTVSRQKNMYVLLEGEELGSLITLLANKYSLRNPSSTVA